MRHVYVHVPFCARRCSYCDFAIAVRKNVPADRYVAAIRAERDQRRARGEWDEEPCDTLYFGGGTPSLLPPEHLAALIELLAPLAGDPRAPSASRGESGEGREVTLEANPDDVTPAAAAAWHAAGINRVSLGAQSFQPSVLRWMHRTHDVAAIPRAVDVLRDAGITNLSLDLIFALPDDLDTEFERDLDRALQLGPEHLSVYGLSVEPRTPLARWISRGATASPTEDRYAREFLLADSLLTRAGFEHYEVSSYALPGRRSRHNSAYWSERPFIGLGPAAHSFSAGRRRWNLGAWAAYERAISEGRDPAAERELLTDEQRLIEHLYLSLRTSDGLETSGWKPRGERVERAWTTQGWLLAGPDRYRLTPEGWLRLDEIVAVLTTSADGG